jgi:quercetin dioxygenase-like cupin family protein
VPRLVAIKLSSVEASSIVRCLNPIRELSDRTLRMPKCHGVKQLMTSIVHALNVGGQELRFPDRSRRSFNMRLASCVGLAIIAAIHTPAYSQETGLAKPNLILQQIVEGLPTSDKQEVRVLTATFKPGDKTVHHTHRFPVAVYVLEGAFSLELKDRPSLTVKAGEAMVEPPNVAMTGFNPSATEMTRVVIFYVSSADTPFLDALHH